MAWAPVVVELAVLDPDDAVLVDEAVVDGFAARRR